MAPVSRPDLSTQLIVLNRAGHYLGTITGSVATDNATTATPFTIPERGYLRLQGDAAFYVSTQFPAASITSSNSELIGAGEHWTTILWEGESKVAVLPVSGTVNVKVFKIKD